MDVNKFSEKSKSKLETCDKRLQKILKKVLKVCDCTVLEGHRSRTRQDDMFHTGKSRIKHPHSKHNTNPSLAVDVAPYPIDWNDRERFSLFAGLVMGVAASMDVKLRWGGDWDGDWLVNDNGFDDLPHFELVD